MRKFFVGVTILIIIGCNTLLVAKYTGDKFTLPLWLQQLLSVFEVEVSPVLFNTSSIEKFSDELAPIKAPINALTFSSNAKLTSAKENTQAPVPDELSYVGGVCAKGRFGTKKPDKSIYVWTNSAGIKHISDTPPRLDNSVPISIVGTYPPAQFVTRFIGTSMSLDFQEQLSLRLERLVKEFAQVVDVTSVREVALNFRFFAHQADFDQHKKRVAPTTPTKSGFYLHSSNEMTILVKDEQTGLNTSIHEAVHAINRTLFGNMARWLNEGLAQVLATKTANIAAINLKPSLPLDKLFNATSADWDGTLRGSLYQSSNAFIAGLMKTVQGRKTIARLLLAEQVNGCNNLNISDISRILGSFNTNLK